MVDDGLIGIREAARQLGLNHSTLSRQVKSGLIRSHDGKVRLSEVLEDRANNIDATIWQARKKPSEGVDQSAVHAPGDTVHAPPPSDDDADLDLGVDDGDLDHVLIDGKALPLGQAKALKETYLARLRKLEFEEKSKRLVDKDVVEKTVFELSRQDRDRWTNWPARVSPLIASELGVDQVALAVVMEKYVREQLNEQSDPGLR